MVLGTNPNRKHIIMTTATATRNLHDFTPGVPANSNKPMLALSRDEILQRAPSVFAENPMPGVSDRYKFVPTVGILDTLEKAGYSVVAARQSATRTPDGHTYAKHSLRLTKTDYLDKGDMPVRARRVGDVVPQVVLTNSHNRTSSFQLEGGLFRLVCSNGLMTAAADFAGARVLHNDPAIYDHIIEGTEYIREVTESVALPMIERMQRTELTEAQALEFATAATFLKFGEERSDHAEALLQARREEDAGRMLWTVLNRIQENVVKGGYMAKDRAGRTVQTRGITSVDKDRDFNVALWQLGAQVVELV